MRFEFYSPPMRTMDGKTIISLVTTEDIGQLYDELHDNPLQVEIKAFKRKRGLTQNGFYWAQLSELARKLGLSNNAMHNTLLRRYGQPERYDDQVVYIMLPDTEEAENKALEAETYHLKPTSHTKPGNDGTQYRAYMLMRGSSTYNTEEFSRLVDGLIQECDDAGVRVMTGREE